MSRIHGWSPGAARSRAAVIMARPRTTLPLWNSKLPSVACAPAWPFSAASCSQRAAWRTLVLAPPSPANSILPSSNWAFGVAIVGGGAHVIFLRGDRIGLDRRAGNARFHVSAERHQRVGDVALLGAARLDVLLRDLVEELERLVVVARDAVAFRIHAGELPGGAELAVLRRIAIGLDSLILVAVLVGGKAEAEHRPRAGVLLGRRLVVEHLVVERIGAAGRHQRGRCDDRRKRGKPY